MDDERRVGGGFGKLDFVPAGCVDGSDFSRKESSQIKEKELREALPWEKNEMGKSPCVCGYSHN